MYKHLLVPIDDTPLADVTVAAAVRFARSTGAQITFFHAAPDLAASGDGALLYTLDTQAFGESQATQGQAALLRARTAAEIDGVICETLSCMSDQPARAIDELGHARGCDLIFLSSHGRTPGWRGWLRGSVTQRLIELTSLPVLVSSVESNQADADMHRVLGIIAAEHRSIAAVLRGMQQTLRQARVTGQALDTALMRQMTDYLRAFPEQLHHPKEEAQLFRLLRLRNSESDQLMQELERQHRRESLLVAGVEQALAHCEARQPGSLEALGDAVQRLAGAVWEHMGVEEAQVFAAARRHLTSEDWSAVSVAFAAHVDPLQGVDEGEPLAQAFARIARVLLSDTSGKT